MKKWILKACIQKVISFLPHGYKINYLFQKYVTKGVYLTDEYFKKRLLHARKHIDAYKKLTGYNFPHESLELGTGWYPIVPIALFLSGADKIFSADITPLVNRVRLLMTIKKFIECHSKGELHEFLSVKEDRMERLKHVTNKEAASASILKEIRLALLQDARSLDLPSEKFDLIHSNNTFEHIYPHILIDILREFKRMAKRGGVMSHYIDMSDHFSHLDRTITIYNFLKFSPRWWSLIDNSIQPQNRLRITDYENLYRQLSINYQILDQANGSTAELRNIKIADMFLSMSLDKIAISHCRFVSLM